jgi:hypothetical protein
MSKLNMHHEILKPLCEVCNKIVDKMECESDFRTNGIHVTVYCHGKTESCYLNDEFRHFASIEPGIAFQKPKQLSDIEKILLPAADCVAATIKELEHLKDE